MKKFRKIVILLVVILGFFIVIPSPSKAAGLTESQRIKIATFAKQFITEGKAKKVNGKEFIWYSQAKRNTRF